MGAILRRAALWLVIGAVGVGGYFGLQARYGAYDDIYRVRVGLPRASQLLRVGTDVRQAGVLVGVVGDIRLKDRAVELTLEIDRRHRVPRSAEAFIDLKTLLGDKFVDLRSDSYAEPFLRDGDRIEGHVGPEVEDVLQSGVDVLGAIDPTEAATVVNELARAARGHGDDIARGLEAGAELSTTFAETIRDQIRGLHDFEVIFGELQHRGDDLNRLAEAVNQGVPVYASAEAHRQLRRVLDAVSAMAEDLSDLLIFQRPDWDRMMDHGDVVLQTMVNHADGLHDLVHGLSRYVFKLGGDPWPLPDGSGAAAFTNFMGGDDFASTVENLCGAIPPEDREQIPVCQEESP